MMLSFESYHVENAVGLLLPSSNWKKRPTYFATAIIALTNAVVCWT
jgi:hypothetical protein